MEDLLEQIEAAKSIIKGYESRNSELEKKLTHLNSRITKYENKSKNDNQRIRVLASRLENINVSDEKVHLTKLAILTEVEFFVRGRSSYNSIIQVMMKLVDCSDKVWSRFQHKPLEHLAIVFEQMADISTFNKMVGNHEE